MSDNIPSRRKALAILGASGVALWARALDARAAGPSGAPSCVVRPQQTEGPFFVEEALNRSDIRADPRSGAVKPGVPLRLTLRVSRMSSASCAPLAGAQVDIWHCDAAGRYSDTGNGRQSGQAEKFLRGYQRTDGMGAAQFLTIYPGWYGGRAVHVHFKIRTGGAATPAYEFTSQLYFDDALNDRVFAQAPYTAARRRAPRNSDDFLFRDGGSRLLLDLVPVGEGYDATFDIGLQMA